MKVSELRKVIREEIKKIKGKKKPLNESFEMLGGVVTKRAFSSVYAPSKKTPNKSWGREFGQPLTTLETSTKRHQAKKIPKLSSLVEDSWTGAESKPKVDVSGFLNEVGRFNEYGGNIYRKGNLKDIAERLAKVAEAARAHTLQETEDWFDKVSVTRNMKELHGLSGGFSKCATEAQSLQERMETLYEDMGNILNRYYNIKEINEGKKGTIKEWVTRSTLHEESYQEFFQKALDKYGVESPSKLDQDKKVEFYDYIDKNWDAKEETD